MTFDCSSSISPSRWAPDVVEGLGEFGRGEELLDVVGVGDGEVGVGWINSQVCVCLVHVPSMGGDDGSSRWWCGYMDRIG